jgi:hypothetical protein
MPPSPTANPRPHPAAAPPAAHPLGLGDAPSAALNAPGSTTVSCLLMQDAVATGKVSVGPSQRPGTLDGTAALFANPYLDGKEEALVVNESGHLAYLRRAVTDTGWDQTELTDVSGQVIPAREVVVVVHPQDLEIWAVYTPLPDGPPQALQLAATTVNGVTTCAWKQVPDTIQPLSGTVTGLRNLYVYYDGRTPIVTGFDLSGHVFIIQCKTGKPQRFTSAMLDFDFSSRGLPDDLAAGRIHGNNPVVVRSWAPIVYLRWGNQLVRYDASVPAETIPPLTLPNQVQDLVGVFRSYAAPDVGVVFLDTAGNLWTWNRGTEHPVGTTSTPGLGLVTATSWIDVNQMLHVYGLDAANTLKVLHQVDTTYNGEPVWSRSTYIDPPPPPGAPSPAPGRGHRHSTDPAKTAPSCVGLVPGVAAFAVDPFPDYQPNELVRHEGTADVAEQVSFYAQDITSARWSRDKVRVPATGTPTEVPHYVSTVTVLDKRGTPMPGLTVKVSADTLAEVQIDGASYLVGPGHAATVATGMLGTVTIATAADSLLPPTLHVDATGLANGAVVQPAAAVHEYLAGTGTLPSQNRRFGTDALADAKVNGRPLVDKDHQGNIDKVVNGTTQSFAKASGTPLTSLGSETIEAGAAIHGFSVGRVHTYKTGDTLTAHYREFQTEADHDAHIAAIRALPEYGGIWEDFAAWAGDVWEGVKNGVIEVYDVTFGAVAKVFIWIGGKIVELIGFIVDSVLAVARAVEALFRMVVKAVSDVVDWLKALFAFGDIWRTAQALQTGFGQVMSYAASTVAQFGDDTHTWFQHQKTVVDTFFDGLKADYAGRPLGDAGNQIPAVSGPEGQVVPQADMRANPQATWMLGQATTARGLTGSGPGSPAFPISQVTQDAWDVFIARCRDSHMTDRFEAILGDVELLLKKIVDPADPALAAKSSMTALIDIVQQLVQAALSALDFVIGAALALLKVAADEIKVFLDQPMTGFPALQSLFDWIWTGTGQPGDPGPLTWGRLLFLILGFGVTTMYKLANGVDTQPFPNGWPNIPAPSWHPDYDPEHTWDSADGAAAAKFFQGIAGLCGLFAMPFQVAGDMLPLRPKTALDPVWMFNAEKIVTALAVLSGTGMCGVLGSIPQINGNEWDGQGGCWKWAFAVQGGYGLLSLAALLTLKAESRSGGGFVKNTAGVVLGPALAAVVSGMYLTLAGTGSSQADQPLYTKAQIAVSAMPGLVQILRIGAAAPSTAPSSPPLPPTGFSVVRACFVAALDGLGLVASSGMTVGAAFSAGPAILTPAQLPPATSNTLYDKQLDASGGDRSFNWGLTWRSLDPLPAGLSLVKRDDKKRKDWKNTFLTGKPTAKGQVKFRLVVSDNYAPPQTSDAVEFTLQVD